jgi:uncharacterized protein (DUF2147 family)
LPIQIIQTFAAKTAATDDNGVTGGGTKQVDTIMEQARDEAGRWTQSNGARSPVGRHAGRASIGTHPATKDGTTDAFGVRPTSGYMVGGGDAHSRYTGRWTDPVSGKTYTEKSTRASSGVLAKSLGRMRNQISVYDLANRRVIGTGGDGRTKAS